MSDKKLSWFIIFDEMPLNISMCDDCLKLYQSFLDDKDNKLNETIMCLHKYRELKEKVLKNKRTRKKPLKK